MIFFAYIGFDAVSTGSEEAKNPKRDLPLAIVGSLAICTLIYIAGRDRPRSARCRPPSWRSPPPRWPTALEEGAGAVVGGAA